MGEAKRRGAARPYATTSAKQVARMITEVFARLPLAPMNGAKRIDLSPSDYGRLIQAAETRAVSVGLNGLSFEGIAFRENPMLVDGVMIGRDTDGKAVWSNQPWMQEAIDADFVPWW